MIRCGIRAATQYERDTIVHNDTMGAKSKKG